MNVENSGEKDIDIGFEAYPIEMRTSFCILGFALNLTRWRKKFNFLLKKFIHNEIKEIL